MPTQVNGSTVTAYPLAWPLGWKRATHPARSNYGNHSLDQARRSLTNEVRLMGGTELVISSNLKLRLDGLPRSDQRQPEDRGVAVYFKYKDQSVSFACDKWVAVEDNLWAINLTISALRQIERCGASEMLERAFKGFDAIPAPAGSMWYEVLGVNQSAPWDEVQAAYRDLARRFHPDSGDLGDEDKFKELSSAYATAKQQYGR